MSQKPQPWYAAFNQPPRSPKHGRNWKPAASSHRHPVDRTSSGVDPGSQDTTAQWTIIPKPARRAINSITNSSPNGPSVTYYDWSTTQLIYRELEPPTIPYAGVRAGELIGHRMWYVLPGDYLCSLAHFYVWYPDATIEGNLDEIVIHFVFSPHVYGGVYSFATFEELERDAKEIAADNFPTTVTFRNNPQRIPIQGVAIGTIKCWGDVVEHERGYRAQYAKLQSIDQVIGKVDIQVLRARYHV